MVQSANIASILDQHTNFLHRETKTQVHLYQVRAEVVDFWKDVDLYIRRCHRGPG